jgi:hypothetical protein
MRRKRRSGASGDEIVEVLVSCGFPRVCGIWFTVAFRETITIAAIGTTGATPPLARSGERGRAPRGRSRVPHSARDKQKCLPRGADGQISNVGNLGRAPRSFGGGVKNEGVGEHVRTKFHMAALRPPVKLRIMRSAPNEENLFLLPDRFSKERTLLKERSSRLT